jgi:hypothetical protein
MQSSKQLATVHYRMLIDDGRMTETCCGNNIRREGEELLCLRTINCLMNILINLSIYWPICIKIIQGVLKNSFTMVFQTLLCGECYENVQAFKFKRFRNTRRNIWNTIVKLFLETP